MTEIEAKKRICPARLIGAMSMMAGSLDRNKADAQAAAVNAASMCIGSGCMLWRCNIKRYPAHDIGDGLIVGEATSVDYYCGLAGK